MITLVGHGAENHRLYSKREQWAGARLASLQLPEKGRRETIKKACY
jgi:hypothetical protein